MLRLVIAVVGPTSVGKTLTSVFLAKNTASEIISCDARQFYRELKIGTAPPSKEMLKEIKHHFIGHLSIHQKYTAGDFEKDALKKLDELFARHSTVVTVGGSGLYEKALTQGLDFFPEVSLEIEQDLRKVFKNEGIKSLQTELKHFDPCCYQTIDLQNPHRLIRALGVIRSSGQTFSSFTNKPKAQRAFRVLKIGLDLPREQIYLRINNRVDQMMQQGLLKEAKTYHAYKHLNALQTVGYKELFRYFEGSTTLADAIEEIKKNTRHYAKRQLTWYRKDQDVHWFSPGDNDKILNHIKDFINRQGVRNS